VKLALALLLGALGLAGPACKSKDRDRDNDTDPSALRRRARRRRRVPEDGEPVATARRTE
jgi:hypothetical protein